MSSSKIKCNVVNYRKGFLEVTPNIHDGYINLETWQVHPDVEITNLDLTDERLRDEGITGNTELELSIEAAECLIKTLRAAIQKLQTGG